MESLGKDQDKNKRKPKVRQRQADKRPNAGEIIEYRVRMCCGENCNGQADGESDNQSKKCGIRSATISTVGRLP